ncbi:MAG: MFS transporter [Bdellovibrionales bacterium]
MRNFRGLFWTQFLGAANDNFFKNALVMLIAFKGMSVWGLDHKSVVALAGGIFILPYFLFSGIAGQICDKWERSYVIRITKLWELLIMLLAATCFLLESYGGLLIVLFFMGMQSTFFSPAKYSSVIDLTEDKDFVKANAQIEMGTFLAILIGTIAGGIAADTENINLIMSAILFMAILGILSSFKIPKIKRLMPELELNWNFLKTNWDITRDVFQSKYLRYTIWGTSWFWFLGAVLLSLIPVLVKDTFHSSQGVATLFLACFTIGIGIGSIICEKLSFQRVELGLTPIGSIGLSIFFIDLANIDISWVESIRQGPLLEMAQFFTYPNSLRILIDMILISIFFGIFIVPLNSQLQKLAKPEKRSRVIAVNNIVNALFMVLGAIVLMVFHNLEIGTMDILLYLGLANIVIATIIYAIIPDFTLRFIAWIIARLMYRINGKGFDEIAEKGPGVIVSNHVSYVDWLLVMACVKRPVRFVMYYKFFKIPVVKSLMKQAGVIPIAGKNESPEILNQAFLSINKALKNGELIAIFPEGGLTRDGELKEFRTGIDKILEANPVPVYPMIIANMWGSLFSHKDGKAVKKMPKRFHHRVRLIMNKVIEAKSTDSQKLKTKIKEMLESDSIAIEN